MKPVSVEVRVPTEAAIEAAEAEQEISDHEDDVEAEVLDHDPDGCEECLEAESAEADVHPADAEEPETVEDEGPPGPYAAFAATIGVKELKQFLAQVGVLVDEARVVASRDGWRVKAVDPAHVAMVDVALPYVAFESFETSWAANAPTDGPERPDEVVFGLDVEKLSKKLKSLKDGTVGFAYEQDDKSGRIALRSAGREDTMSAIDTDAFSEPKVPDLNLPATVDLPGAVLLEAVKAASEISDHVRLTASGNGLAVLAEGDVDRVSMNFPRGERDVEVVIGGDKDTYTSLFPLDYLEKFLKTVKGETLSVDLGTDYPLRADWDGATKGTFLLAPRIETDP